MTRWWTAHGHLFSALDTVIPWALFLGLLGLPTSLLMQLERTRRVLGLNDRRKLAHPVFMAHGVNVLLPSLLGDLYEIGALAKITNTNIHAVLTRLIHRFVTTLSALALLAAFALGSQHTAYGIILFFLAIIGPLLVDRLTPQWSQILRVPTAPAPPKLQGLGMTETLIHMGLALGQHILSAAGRFFLGKAIIEGVSAPQAAAMLSIADLVTYLPVPMAGIGVHHWSITVVAKQLGDLPATLVALHHGYVVLVGIGCIGLAYWARDRAE